ncbi:anthranilate phosphoribosyltransferase [Streptomonospora litoralis]|uniref:Anthranilate phosphoribosyltransferase n=1 Tax=Streptomonospora litoralis TaxID=2498135 RepID=A0A4P6Q2P8_9ACTN|nr:hypothetical protein [Streptomonospora litoralis]QBI54926.1 Anthranilate phosphoribosyltransferase [Streptomonospora litoralis]
MHEVITALLNRRPVTRAEDWRSLWDRLGSGGLDRAEAAALLGSLATHPPEAPTLRALLDSLSRRPAASADRCWPATVNTVGTGGGPSTFNVSTAAAFVAAAMGVRVVKTGSRAYSSRLGSVDLLERLGVRLTGSLEETADAVDRDGIAFAGPFVYPPELTALARAMAPVALRPFGRFLNAVGPFLADLPVAAQVTGVSAAMPLAELRQVAQGVDDRLIWLCTNDLGADELLGFCDNTVYSNAAGGGTPVLRLRRGELLPERGGIEDLRPFEPDDAVRRFREVLAGPPGAATDTVCLNAAAAAVAAGAADDWPQALDAAREAVAEGAALALLDRLRERSQTPGTLQASGGRHG